MGSFLLVYPCRMPYKSDAQRRFFHSEGAAKAGITPAMVVEWDSASKGKDTPERKKAAEIVDALLAKTANTTSSAFKLSKPATPHTPVKVEGPKPTPYPGDYKPSFLDNSGAAAQRGSADKLQVGDTLTMPT